ncbi:NAD(+)/NADH kinase [Simkania negevensis]|uniref:NAD kinase n=1 Tax=Simkania negevensis (strain ATCC VR-1471 / DSM 27360 / Z) TaxID=331113 RepID=F8L7N1_SIMNZ|nr:NAD(+)/NADH kinase [Simkania negevensis]CCB88764.1 putative inorganic polyphosphate/ATP-NAD kinase [Simkania negevensis Z]
MKTIALFPKVKQPDAKKLAEQVITFLKEKKIHVVVEDDKAEVLNQPPLSSANPGEIKYLITMGGDGSILRVAHMYHYLDAAILGINLGHLGFMADVQIADIIPCLEDLVNQKFSIQKRIMIEGTSPSGETFFAMNDCVLHRARNPSLVEMAIYVDDLYLNTFEADGVILATPNGSTAYSLAAGGPILSPDIEAFVLTPICPHTISNRPIVLTPNQEIQIEYVSENEPIEVVSDGLSRFELQTGETIKLRRSPKTFKLVNLTRIDFFSTLRTKLGWSGKLR